MSEDDIVKSTTLSDLMVKDHAHILKLLKEVTSHIADDVELVMRLFQNFKKTPKPYKNYQNHPIFTLFYTFIF